MSKHGSSPTSGSSTSWSDAARTLPHRTSSVAVANDHGAKQLAELAAASDKPDLTADDLARVAELQRTNFGVHEDHMRYKGTMLRDGEPIGPAYRYPDDSFPGAPVGEPAEVAAD